MTKKKLYENEAIEQRMTHIIGGKPNDRPNVKDIRNGIIKKDPDFVKNRLNSERGTKTYTDESILTQIDSEILSTIGYDRSNRVTSVTSVEGNEEVTFVIKHIEDSEIIKSVGAYVTDFFGR